MVWILRRRTRTLAKWVMSPANLKIFMFIGSDLRRVDPDLCPATIGFRRRCAARLKCVWPLHTSRENKTSEHVSGESHFYFLSLYLIIFYICSKDFFTSKSTLIGLNTS